MVSFVIALFLMAFAAAFAVGILIMLVRAAIGICKFIGYIVLIASLPLLWVLIGINWVALKIAEWLHRPKIEYLGHIDFDDEPQMKDITPLVRRLEKQVRHDRWSSL